MTVPADMSSRRLRFAFAPVLVAIVLAIACSRSHRAPTGGDPPSPAGRGPGATPGSSPNDDIGVLGAQLTLPGGEQFSVINYTVANAATTMSGSVNIGGAAPLNFYIANIPADTGYALSLNATSVDGAVVCAFPAPGIPPIGNIDILSETTTQVAVNLECLSTADAGPVSVAAPASNCPQWTSIVATPSAAPDAGATVDPGSDAAPIGVGVGQSLGLVAYATAPDPSQLSFSWSAAAGSFSSSTGTIGPGATDAGASDQTTFTCPSTPGPVVISLAVADGPLPEGGSCDPSLTQGSITVDCQGAAPCDSGTGCTDSGVGDAEAGASSDATSGNDASDALTGDDGSDASTGDGGDAASDSASADDGAGDGGTDASDAAGATDGDAAPSDAADAGD
jgi:hypothetical protein